MDDEYKNVPNLDTDSIERLNSVRKIIWTGGLKGLVFGMSLSACGFIGTSFLPQFKKYRQNKYFVVTILVSGSVCSFLGSVTAGRNSIYQIEHLFHINSTPKSSYENILRANEDSINENSDVSFGRRQRAIELSRQRNLEKFDSEGNK